MKQSAHGTSASRIKSLVRLLAALQFLALDLPAIAQEDVLWVDVNNFAAERRLRGISLARQALDSGKASLYLPPPFGPLTHISKQEERKLIKRSALMDKVMRAKDIEPVHAYPSECTGNSGEYAYVEAFNQTILSALREKWGREPWEELEAEVDRRLAHTSKGAQRQRARIDQ